MLILKKWHTKSAPICPTWHGNSILILSSLMMVDGSSWYLFYRVRGPMGDFMKINLVHSLTLFAPFSTNQGSLSDEEKNLMLNRFVFSGCSYFICLSNEQDPINSLLHLLQGTGLSCFLWFLSSWLFLNSE